ncbi:topoisomerase DNA-binding C4 zinc finger domain-containing protein [Alkalilimnicola ehrlichii]|uniref:topoisomerase DNA-binding C4 zinc finger domain-containing protein n=1 Tax=Alkalilimnicola ehrlichii TaxID=351052 RepID=UPI0002FCB471|nr:topoisomerase DNA-binding C4 zinc finger domain-containing protein [Alkalilimnicola ehrlichii]
MLSESEVQDLLSQIKSGRLEPTRKTHRQHVQQLRSRSDPTAERKCPRCGNDMVLRTAKRGANAGNQFWGCSGYPKCRAVQSVS